MAGKSDKAISLVSHFSSPLFFSHISYISKRETLTHLKGPSIHFPGSCTAPNILAKFNLEVAAVRARRAIPRQPSSC